ncbi:hypothetical protein QY97_03948 [Bacillus thermotolerans]|nr:hypothetical protein QY97_03948 [Bacillus thermotolerans]
MVSSKVIVTKHSFYMYILFPFRHASSVTPAAEKRSCQALPAASLTCFP